MELGEPPKFVREYVTQPSYQFLSVYPKSVLYLLNGHISDLTAVELPRAPSGQELLLLSPTTNALTCVTSLDALNYPRKVSHQSQDPPNSSKTWHVI